MYSINQFKNKNVLITGATRGIGLAIKNEFEKFESNVYYTGTKTLDKDLNEKYLRVNYSNESEFNQFLKNIGEIKFDIVINNVGINKIGEFDSYSSEDFLEIQKINLFRPFEIIKSILPHMKQNNWGRVVNISSIFGKISKEFRFAYSSSKFGLDGMTIALSAEVSRFGILANCVAPGFVDTELTHTVLSEEQIKNLMNQVPMKRLAKPEEIAKLVLWLCSEENSFVTGQNIAIDGGFSRV